MKGPYENAKVYAIAAMGKAGIAGGVIPAVYAYDQHAGEDRFFTVSNDEFDENDLYEARPREGELRLNGAEEPNFDVPDRQVLSLWSEREEALEKFKQRSERGKAAAQTAKDRKAAAVEEQMRARREAREATPIGRIKQIARHVEYAFTVKAQHGNSEYVMVQMRVSPDKFRKMMTARGVDDALIDEFFADDNDIV